MVFFKKSLLVVFSLFLLLAGCDKGGENKATEDFQEWSGRGAQNEKKIESLKASLYENPGNVKLLSALGDAYFESEKFKEALVEYEKVLKIDPKDPDSLNDRGLAYFYLGDSEAALESIDMATKADPTYKHAWLSKGYMLLSLGKYAEAEESLEKVKELDPMGLGLDAENFLAQIDLIKGQQ